MKRDLLEREASWRGGLLEILAQRGGDGFIREGG